MVFFTFRKVSKLIIGIKVQEDLRLQMTKNAKKILSPNLFDFVRFLKTS